MSNNKKTGNQTYENPDNPQQKIADMQNSVNVNVNNINQGHNSKKVAQGPNTKR